MDMDIDIDIERKVIDFFKRSDYFLQYSIIDYRTNSFGVDYAEVLHFNSTSTSTSTSSFLIISFHERRKPLALRNYTYT
jgi:hypothetical protein